MFKIVAPASVLKLLQLAAAAASAGASFGCAFIDTHTPPPARTKALSRNLLVHGFRNRRGSNRRSFDQEEAAAAGGGVVFDSPPQARPSYACGGASTRWSKPATCLLMGLYDQPLPPRPPPIPPNKRGRQSDRSGSFDDDDEDEDDDDDDEDEFDNSGITDQQGPVGAAESASSTRINLFTFDEKGREINNLLPNLGRRLDRGVGCYYEPSDRVVQSLVRRTSCSPVDACWALEACKGDVTEAWTRISVARRTNLEEKRLTRTDSSPGEGGEDADTSTYQVLDADVLELEMEEEFMELKQRRMEDQKKRDFQDFFKGGEKDQDWLPRQTKGPVDDEPWFTG